MYYFINFRRIFNYSDPFHFISMGALPVCLYAHLNSWHPRRSEKGVGSPGIGIMDIVNHHACAGKQIRVLCKNKYSYHLAIFLATYLFACLVGFGFWESYCVSPAGLEPTMYITLILNSQNSAYLCLLSARIKSMCYHTWLTF